MIPFEKRIAETPLRPVPPEWRGEILAAAQTPDRHSRWIASVYALLWPHPYAWGALAACWVAIAALNFSGPRGPELYAVTPKGMKPIDISPEQYVEYVRLRDRLLLASEAPEERSYRIDRSKL